MDKTQLRKLAGITEGFYNLTVVGSDSASDLASEAAGAMAKVLKKGMKDKGNEYNTPGYVNVAMILGNLPDMFKSNEELREIGQEALKMMNEKKEGWVDFRAEYAHVIKKLEKFLA